MNRQGDQGAKIQLASLVLEIARIMMSWSDTKSDKPITSPKGDGPWSIVPTRVLLYKTDTKIAISMTYWNLTKIAFGVSNTNRSILNLYSIKF